MRLSECLKMWRVSTLMRYTGRIMLTVFKPAVEKGLEPVARLLKHVSPNTISMFGLVFPVLFFIFVMRGWYALALFVFIFNGLDLLDGMVARATNKVTAFGGFLDSTIDRFADFTVIAALGFAGLVGWNIILPFIMLTYLISYIRSRTELAALSAGNTLVASVGLIERTERLVAIFIGLLLYAIFPHVMLWHQNLIGVIFIILIVLSVITVWQRVVFAYKKLSKQ